jgi:hypothetical protein
MNNDWEIDLDEYLARGIGALTSAREEHWVFGHFGAAMLAGVWLLRDGNLPRASAATLGKRLKDTVRADPKRYRVPELGKPGDPDLLFDSLTKNIATLRNGAHGTVYTAAALLALREQPELATARTIDSLLEVHRNAQIPDPDRYYGIENHDEVEVPLLDPRFPRDDDEEIVAVCILALETLYPDRVIDDKRYFFTGEKLHLLTHAQALFRLDSMGHPELKALGWEALRRQAFFCEQVPPDRAPSDGVFDGPSNPAYWKITGDPWHDIKFAQAAQELLSGLGAEQREQLGSPLANVWASLGA